MGRQHALHHIFKPFLQIAFAFALTVALASVAQVPAASQSSPTTDRPRVGFDPKEAPDSMSPMNTSHIQKMREDERHKRLMADAERLLALTGELKAELDKASKDELSLDVVRKAAEIEKLAHDVKERMKS